MSKIFDKLLFALALLAFAAGAGFVLREHLEKQKTPAQAEVGLSDSSALTDAKPYQNVTRPNPVSSGDSWTGPQHDEDLDIIWHYDLFTAAGVQWSKSGKAYQPSGTEPDPEEPFGIKLLSITRPVYRLVLKGEIPVKLPDGKAVLAAQIYDSQGVIREPRTGTVRRGIVAYNVQKGQTIKAEGLDISILDYTSLVVANANGTKENRRTLVVRDNIRKQDITLKLNQPHEFEELTDIELARDDNPSEKWMWRSAGDKKNLGDLGEFTLKAIDFQNKTVTVEKKYEKASKNKNKKNPSKTQTETLRLSKESVSVPKTKPATGTNTNT